jgi:O-antigen/teichoic acid export membrane protein
VLFGTLNAFRHMRWYAVLQAVRWLLIVGGGLYGVAEYDLSLTWLVAAFPVTELALFPWLFFLVSRRLRFSWTDQPQWRRAHFSFGSRTVLASLAGELNNNLDVLLMGLFLSTREVGIYSLAARVARGIFMLPGVVQTNFNPLISRLWSAGDRLHLQQQIGRLRTAMLFIMVPLTAAALVCYPFFVRIFMPTPEFTESIGIFAVLMIGVAIVSVFYFCGAVLLMTGHPGLQLALILVTLASTAVLNIILVPWWQLYGAALATALSMALSVATQIWFARRFLCLNLLAGTAPVRPA